MAGFGFTPQQPGGFGGGMLSQGMGPAIGNAANAGLRLANGFREYQNNNMLDQFQIPAAEANYDNARLEGANGAVRGQTRNAMLMAMANEPGFPSAPQIPQQQPQPPGPGTFYQANPGAINQNGMQSIGADMVMGNPYPNSVYGSNAFQQALTGNNQNGAMAYQPSAPNYLQY